MSENYIEMELREIQTSDDLRDLPIVVLAEVSGDREFPIFIGHLEARALEDAALGTPVVPLGIPRRPMTHDLILNVIDGLEAGLERVLITRLDSGTFYGALELKCGNDKKRIDSRPSDALVLAVKRRVSIFVEEKVLAEVQRENNEQPE